MPIIAAAKAGGNFKPCPEGVHDAICTFVVDVGYEHSEDWDKEIHKVYLCWEINEPMEDGRPFMISKKYTVSLSDKAILRRDLEGWRSKKFTDEELKGFDIEVLRGKQCQLQIIHMEKSGKIYANIQTVLPKSKASPVLKSVNTQIPEWILRIKDANEARMEALDAAPIVMVEEKPQTKIAPTSAGFDEPPF